jgi:hypothetical protein
LAGAALALLLNSRPETPLDRLAPLGLSAPPAVSAHDATALPRPSPTAEAASAVCGARTKKGRPCKRRVRPGLRCAQHQGQPSMLKEQAASPDAAK